MSVTFHTKNLDFSLGQKRRHKRWVKEWIESHQAVCGDIAYVFTSNKHIKLINQEYLNHNYFTDVISFDYTEGKKISGDIFISVDQVRKNAVKFNTEVEEEIRRVMIHGVIHLMGYKDANEQERKTMHQLENEALHLWLKMV
ncbi:MAG: rRNA maturation RNase YbeY [Bacteroidales bacterium]|nr:rRNA maturation RNase YbeY [Bacteroidales bacterium]